MYSRPYRGQLFFFKLTADLGLVVDWIARLKPGQTLTLPPERRLIFHAFCGSTQLHSHATSANLLTVDAFRVQVRFGKNIFLAFLLVSIQV